MKKIRLTKTDIYTTLMTLLSALPGVIVYTKIPDRIATHFGINGEPDGWSSKVFAVFGLPLVLAALHMIACIITNLDERTEKQKITGILHFVIPATAFAVQTMIMLYALGILSDVPTVSVCILSVLFIVLGNYLPKTRQNSAVGVRTKNTLSDERVWEKTHRLAGYLMTAAGVISLVISFLGLALWAFVILTAALIVPVIYQAVI